METYEEIAQKYAGAVEARKKQIIVAQNRVELTKAKLESWKEVREQFRQDSNYFSAERAREWRRITYRLQTIKKELSDAEINLAKAYIGHDIDEEIEKIM